jgi:hypothetical protein
MIHSTVESFFQKHGYDTDREPLMKPAARKQEHYFYWERGRVYYLNQTTDREEIEFLSMKDLKSFVEALASNSIEDRPVN